MIFSREEARRILRGAQTFDVRRVGYHTRRDGDFKRPCPYPPGSAHAITVRGVKRLEPKHLVILTATETQLGELRQRDANRMGLRTTDDMYDVLRQRWRIGIPNQDGLYNGVLNHDLPVWALTFEIARDLPRLLRAGMGREGDALGDYTHTAREAMVMEPEAVDASTLTAQTADARSAERVRVAAETRVLIRQLQMSIAALAARDDIGEDAARRLRRMRMDVARLQTQLDTE